VEFKAEQFCDGLPEIVHTRMVELGYAVYVVENTEDIIIQEPENKEQPKEDNESEEKMQPQEPENKMLDNKPENKSKPKKKKKGNKK